MAFINFQIQVPITSSWSHIELLRSSVLNCLATIFSDNEFCHSVGMITSELLENAVKYGDWNSLERAEFQLHVAGDETQVEVTVSNPVREGGSEVEQLFRTVDFIRSQESAESAYRSRLSEVARGQSNGVSRLGLARVAYEGHCEVKARIDDRSILHVTAISTSRR
ncbi:MAG: hypothetical protein P1V51_02990 [Deltaproteobacteria bacterium]|nr:hypothetical protein [Deltaproteobacteria bacterium]